MRHGPAFFKLLPAGGILHGASTSPHMLFRTSTVPASDRIRPDASKRQLDLIATASRHRLHPRAQLASTTAEPAGDLRPQQRSAESSPN